MFYFFFVQIIGLRFNDSSLQQGELRQGLGKAFV